MAQDQRVGRRCHSSESPSSGRWAGSPGTPGQPCISPLPRTELRSLPALSPLRTPSPTLGTFGSLSGLPTGSGHHRLKRSWFGCDYYCLFPSLECWQPPQLEREETRVWSSAADSLCAPEQVSLLFPRCKLTSSEVSFILQMPELGASNPAPSLPRNAVLSA